MNADQQTLNLTTMKTKKARVSFAQTSIRWVNFLNELKNDIDNNIVTGLYPHVRRHNVSNQWVAFLKSNNIVYINESGYFEWNNKIPVSRKIVEAFREYQAEKNEKYSLDNYIKIKKVSRKQPIREQKVDVTKLKLYAPYQEKKVGLIRKFLKWIY